jgi:ATP-binding cassette subfamily B multidrug efflux pump
MKVSAFRRLLQYVLRYRRAFVAGLACVVCTRAVALASPLVLGHAIDELSRGVTRARLAEYAALLLAIGLVGGVFLFLQRRILISASRDIEYDMRNDFFAHLETLPLAYFQTHRTGDLMSRATNDLNAVRMMIGPSIMYSANTMLTLVVALSVMVTIDARLTLWALVPMPFVSISVKLFGSAIHKRFEQIQAQLSEVSAVAQEALSGVRVVRAYRQEQAELERFRRSNDEYLRRNRRLIVLQGFFFPIMSFFLGLGALLVLWLGGREVIRGRISVGQFVAFNSYLTMLSWPMIADANPNCPWCDRVPRPGVLVRRHADPESRFGEDRRGRDGGARRRHGIGQVHAHFASRPPPRSAARDGVHRRRRRSRPATGHAAGSDRVRAAGAVSVFGHSI